MKSTFPLAVVIALATGGAAMADDDCRAPMAQWQSRDTVMAHVASLGLSGERLKIDDGCYEIKGRDQQGNKVEVKIDPASLALVKLKVEFRTGSDPSVYLPGARGQASPAPQAPTANPLFTPGVAPQVSGN